MHSTFFDLKRKLNDEKKGTFTDKCFGGIKEEVEVLSNCKEILTIEAFKEYKKIKKTKDSKFFENIKDFALEKFSKERMEKSYYNLIKKASEELIEDNLKTLREKNKEIRMLKFEETKISYVGETKKNKDNSFPVVMDGFGLFKDEEKEEFYLGKYLDDNFLSGIWIKEKSLYFIGDFKYENKDKKQEKTGFSGLIVNFSDEHTCYHLYGDFSYPNATFNGISLKSDVKQKEIQLDIGDLKEGKKNSKDFYTLRLQFDDNKKITSFKLFLGDFEEDKLINSAIIEDDFSIITYDESKNKFFSVFSTDSGLIYRGDFKIDDMNEIIPIFEGHGFLFDLENELFYSGEFKEGKRTGKGNLISIRSSADNSHPANNIIFEGEFLNDNLIQGNIIEDEKQLIVNGKFDEEMNLIEGKVYYSGNEFYVGQFKDNKRNGNGVYRYENKYEYHGEWKNGMRDGKGTLFYEDRDKRIVGEWAENRLVTLLEHNLDNDKRAN